MSCRPILINTQDVDLKKVTNRAWEIARTRGESLSNMAESIIALR
jgi:hypothetical protein